MQLTETEDRAGSPPPAPDEAAEVASDVLERRIAGGDTHHQIEDVVVRNAGRLLAVSD